ncbi:MAG: histidine phosphatase family protein [Spirochaetaceae bacterium]|jgi:probable phosphoglycerate mutase|nr:histidine phosphatase family protein [Spirochaetaceae bacterium]
MRFLIIRHGDPDYEHDSLTDLGRRQAAALAGRLAKFPLKRLYSSPYGRALATAQYTAGKTGLPVEKLEWIREMNDVVVSGKLRNDLAVWHISPRRLSVLAREGDGWIKNRIFEKTLLSARLQEMEQGGRILLKEYGLSPEERGYTREWDLAGGGDAAIFCHQGSGITFMAWLLRLSPPDFWRCMYIAPASVSIILVEQPEDGLASMRMVNMGDLSCLHEAGPSGGFPGLLYNVD